MSFFNFLEKVGDVVNKVDNAFDNLSQGINKVNRTLNAFDAFVDDPFGFVSRQRRGSIPYGAEPIQPVLQSANFLPDNGIGDDWRVRLHIPATPTEFRTSPVFAPLMRSNSSLVFPTTPQILVTHSANYSNIQPTHTNYPYPVYQSSQVEDITITGEFPVENEADGAYWISAVHFLRSITKMFYGEGSAKGAPPPRVALSGYGDVIFDRTPVIVKMFSVDLPAGVDYIKVPFSETNFVNTGAPGTYTYVPTLSTLNITVQPVYSRDKTRQFNLTDYANGAYIGTDNGGFI